MFKFSSPIFPFVMAFYLHLVCMVIPILLISCCLIEINCLLIYEMHFSWLFLPEEGVWMLLSWATMFFYVYMCDLLWLCSFSPTVSSVSDFVVEVFLVPTLSILIKFVAPPLRTYQRSRIAHVTSALWDSIVVQSPSPL